MLPMPSSRPLHGDTAFYRALAASCLVHLLLLLLPSQEPAIMHAVPSRMEARLQARPAVAETPAPATEAPRQTSVKPDKAKTRTRILSAKKSSTPTWTTAEKSEMDSFLNELEKAPKPSLAQRSLAMAREQGRQMAVREEAEEALLELRPNAPPVNAFSLETYLDGMVRRLNRSAAFVQRNQQDPGIRPAAVQFRLHPDGSLKSFVVLNAGDQAGEIAYIKAIIERSLPFSPFPPDIDRAARSLGITICIRPGSSGDGAGFTRMNGNRCS